MIKAFQRSTIESSIISVIAILSAVGIVVLISAYLGKKIIDPDINILQPITIQIISFAIGAFSLYIAWFFPYQKYKKFIIPLVVVSLFFMLLLATDLSIDRNGVVRWLDFTYFTFQPSELLKVATVFGYAYLFSSNIVKQKPIIFYSLTIGGLGILAIASYAQPDFGTFLILGFVFFAMTVVAKLSRWWWYVFITFTIAITAISPFVLPTYVVDRFTTSYKLITDQISYEERFGIGYQAIQNIEAVTSGGATGQGIGYSIQKLGTLPEATTDTIFALAAEELGFLGVSSIVLLFLLLITMGFIIAQRSIDIFGKLLATGIITLIGTGAFLNILIVLGAPATGIPLLLFSKSGTSVLLTLFIIGVLLNIARQQRQARKMTLKL